MPAPRVSQLSPPSPLVSTPPTDTPTVNRWGSRGHRANGFRRNSHPHQTTDTAPHGPHNGRLRFQLSPPSVLWNNPPGMVPHHNSPGADSWPGTRLQILSRAHGVGLPLTGFTGSSYPSGQCLHDVHLAVSIDGVTEVGTVPNRLGIDEISPCADATRPVRRVRSPGPCCCWRKPRPTPLVPSSLRPTVGGNRCGVACWR